MKRKSAEERFSDYTGAAAAHSAVRLRLVLAVIGLLMFGVAAVVLAANGVPVVWIVIPVVLALLGVVDVVVLLTRHRG